MFAVMLGLFLMWFFLTTVIVRAIYRHATRSYPYASEETFKALKSLDTVALLWQIVAMSFIGTSLFFFFGF